MTERMTPRESLDPKRLASVVEEARALAKTYEHPHNINRALRGYEGRERELLFEAVAKELGKTTKRKQVKKAPSIPPKSPSVHPLAQAAFDRAERALQERIALRKWKLARDVEDAKKLRENDPPGTTGVEEED